MALFDVIVNTCGLVGEDGVPAKKRSSIHLEVKGDVLDNDAMGGHIKGDPVQGGGEGPDAIVLSPPQAEYVALGSIVFSFFFHV